VHNIAELLRGEVQEPVSENVSCCCVRCG
jgi:hypothetical protein